MPSPAVDGFASATATNVTTVAVTLTTVSANDIIVIQVYSEATGGSGTAASPAVSTVTATGLTFTNRSKSFVSGNKGRLETWWALSSAALTSKVITVTYAAAFDDAVCIGFGVSGCNTTAPWDTNASLPSKLSFNATTAPSHTISTDYNNTLLIYGLGCADGTGTTPNSPTMPGFTAITDNGTTSGLNYGYFGCQARAMSGMLTSFTSTRPSTYPSTNSAQSVMDALISSGSTNIPVTPVSGGVPLVFQMG